MVSPEIVGSVIDYLEIEDPNELVLSLAESMGEEGFISVVKDVILGRVGSEDSIVGDIQFYLEMAVTEVADSLGSEIPEDGSMDEDIAGVAEISIADGFSEVRALADLGFNDAASDVAMRVAKAMGAATDCSDYRFASSEFRQAAEEIRANVRDGNPSAWFRFEYDPDDLDDDEDDF